MLRWADWHVPKRKKETTLHGLHYLSLSGTLTQHTSVCVRVWAKLKTHCKCVCVFEFYQFAIIHHARSHTKEHSPDSCLLRTHCKFLRKAKGERDSREQSTPNSPSKACSSKGTRRRVEILCDINTPTERVARLCTRNAADSLCPHQYSLPLWLSLSYQILFGRSS